MSNEEKMDDGDANPNTSGGGHGDDNTTNARNNTNASTVSRNRIPKKPRPKFVGETVEMNGHVFQTFKESQDKRQYTKTMEALQRYVNKNCKYAGDLDSLFKPEKPTITPPADISSDDATDTIKLLKWTESTKTYFRREQAFEDNLRDIYSII